MSVHYQVYRTYLMRMHSWARKTGLYVTLFKKT